jgi:hypothetical protein
LPPLRLELPSAFLGVSNIVQVKKNVIPVTVAARRQAKT